MGFGEQMTLNFPSTSQMEEAEIPTFLCLTEVFAEIICREMDHQLLELTSHNSNTLQNQWFLSACNLLPIFTNLMAKAEIGIF